MKTCLKCNKVIDEKDDKTVWVMLITKRGQRIIEFECFHLGCWKGVVGRF